MSNVRVPDAIAERIVAAVRSMMPPDFDIELRGRSVMLRSGGSVIGANSTGTPSTWPGMFSPRNRDGVTQRSIGWASWFLLDTILHMSRSRGAPIDKPTAKRLQAYTQVRDGYLYCWLGSQDNDPEITFPAVDLTDVTPEPPQGQGCPSGWHLVTDFRHSARS